VVLATMATVIASQALISGAFSLTRQAVQLGYSPRVNVRHTSATEVGQIYIASVNWALMVVCIALVVGFRESENLAAAYGLAVSATMTITTIIFYVVVRERFHWARGPALALCGLFLVIDGAFLGATLFKIPDGGWIPLVIAAVVVTLMSTWRTGRRLVNERLYQAVPRLDQFIASLAEHPPVRAPGTGAFLFRHPGLTPPALLAALRHHDSLHERVLIISVVTAERPRVHPLERADVADLGQGFHQVMLHFGFMEDPDVPRALAGRVVTKLGVNLETITYFVGREAIRVTSRPGMARWRERLFVLMWRNSTSAATYLGLPLEQTVEIGVGVEL
jgi:KUP system potassium uptake protein